MKKLSEIFNRKIDKEPSTRFEICISGSGGQGIILAGIVLAEAAAIYDGKNAIQTQSYGPEARGGASRCEVVISDEEIDYPKTLDLDLLLALNQLSLDKHFSRLKKSGILIVDSILTRKIPRNSKKNRCYSFPFTSIANNDLGNIIVANMVALGALVKITKIVSFEALQKAMTARVRQKYLDLNNKALLAGFEYAEKFLKGKKL